MRDEIFQLAARRAAAVYQSEEAWFNLTMRERATAIYRELRAIDVDRRQASVEKTQAPGA